jgi:parvulin-like peptidyl-prolyl isomerase
MDLKRALALSVLAVGACLFAACKSDRTKGTVLAQVGNASLTLEELRESFPAEYEQLIRREQYLDFIKRWIDDEVLYQQAVKGRLDDDPQVKRRLEKLARKLLIEEFLARENSSEAFEPDEISMNQYYEMNKEDFRRKVPEIKFAHIRVATARQAADIKGKILTDNAFLAQAASSSLDPVPESIASLPYKKQAELPSCLAAEIAAARIGQNTQPIACPDGVYIARILDRQEAGSLISFAEAKDEIGATLLMERKDKLLDGRVQKYKEGIAISYNLDQIPGLTETASEVPAAGDTSSQAHPAPRVPMDPAEAAAAQAERLDAVEPTPPTPKPRRRPRPSAPAPAAVAPAVTPPTQPSAAPETAAPVPVQEENPHAPKPDAPSP